MKKRLRGPRKWPIRGVVGYIRVWKSFVIGRNMVTSVCEQRNGMKGQSPPLSLSPFISAAALPDPSAFALVVFHNFVGFTSTPLPQIPTPCSLPYN